MDGGRIRNHLYQGSPVAGGQHLQGYNVGQSDFPRSCLSNKTKVQADQPKAQREAPRQPLGAASLHALKRRLQLRAQMRTAGLLAGRTAVCSLDA